MPINGGTDDSTSEEMAAEEKSVSHAQDVQALSSDNDQRVSSDHPTQDPPSLPSAISTCSGGKLRIKCPRRRIVSRFIVYIVKNIVFLMQ